MADSQWSPLSPGTNILRFPHLTNSNYRTWKRNMAMLLRERTLYGFVVPPSHEEYVACPNSTVEAASPGVKAKYLARRAQALSTIFLGVSESVKPLLHSYDTPYEAWQKLEDVFTPKTMARIGYLHRSFVSMKMSETETMAQWTSRVQNAVTELADTGKTVPEDEHGFLLLNGLPKAWDSIVANIYNLPKAEFKPTKIESMLFNEFDRQHPTGASTHNTESGGAFNTGYDHISSPSDTATIRGRQRNTSRGRSRGRGRGRGARGGEPPAQVRSVTSTSLQLVSNKSVIIVKG